MPPQSRGAEHQHHGHHHHDRDPPKKTKKAVGGPSGTVFQKKRYHGCSICISGVVSERYTDPSRILPRDSTDMLAFIKFRSVIERDFLSNFLMLLKHLEEIKLLSPTGRQKAFVDTMEVFQMSETKAGCTIHGAPPDTDEAVNRVALARVVLEVCLALPAVYWSSLGQHQACLGPSLFDAASRKAHRLWCEVLYYLERELHKPRDDSVKIVPGMRLEARFAGRRAFFAATVLAVHPASAAAGEKEESYDLKYDSSFQRAAAAKARANGATGDVTALSLNLAGGGGAGSPGGGGSRGGGTFQSSLLDDGEVERRVPWSLVRLFPEPPVTAREDHLLRVSAHLKRVLRLGTERPVELGHFRPHYMPPLAPHVMPDPIVPGSGGASMWLARKPAAVRGLYDVNRTQSFVFRGKYGWPRTDDSMGVH